MERTTVSGRVHIGCSGWAYKHWREIFYETGLPQRRWFERYAEEFDTVEINSSFYRLPPGETFRKWREQAPDGFCYAVKANRYITQAKKLMECEESLARMLEAVRELGPHLGPVLYQLPPSFSINLERLRQFLEILPRDPKSVFEFRNRQWYRAETYDLLNSHGASFCVHDMTGSKSERIAVGSIAYVRFHGAAGKYWGRYADRDLLSWADWIANEARGGRSVWCFFNNDIHGHAIEDARALRAMVRQMTS